jgi:Flp pilus assembly protein TadG
VDWARRRQRDQRGTSTLEFILLLPLLLFVWFGIMEFSRAWHTLNILTTAAREGARVGSTTPTLPNDVFDPSAAEARIDGILAAANLLTGATRTVTCIPAECVPDSEVRALVSVTFETAVPLPLPILQSLTIEQSASMRYE